MKRFTYLRAAAVLLMTLLLGEGAKFSPPPEERVGIVVIDPGHGGRDCGARSKTGLMEKQVTLDLARTLGQILGRKYGIQVHYTRDRDRYVSLKDRAKFANDLKPRADLFISIHMNSSRNRKAGGIETYIYGRTASTREIAALAQRENVGISKLDAALDDLMASAFETRSLKVGELVVEAIERNLHVRYRYPAVKRMPFYVIAKTRMPSILIEVAFISNPKEEEKIKSSWWRLDVARAISEGIGRYKEFIEKRAVP